MESNRSSSANQNGTTPTAGGFVSNKKRILGFDGIRALAVIAVILTHFGAYSSFENSPLVPLIYGATGVIFFFVLSGFLITSLLIDEIEVTGKISLKNFYIRRSLRIFPLYYLSLLLVALISKYVYPIASGAEITLAGLYAYNFVPTSLYAPVLGHTWSLAVEEHFYLLWPFLFLTFYKKNRTVLYVILIGAIVGAYPLLVLLTRLKLFEAEFFLDRWTPIAGSYIAIGCFFALLLHSSGIYAHKWRNYLGSIYALLLALILYLSSVLPVLPWHADSFVRSYSIGLMIAWIFLNQHSVIVKLLEFPLLRFVGVISYGLYIFQGIFLSTGPAREPGQIWPPSPLIGLIATLIIAPVSYYLFERPILKIKKKFERY